MEKVQSWALDLKISISYAEIFEMVIERYRIGQIMQKFRSMTVTFEYIYTNDQVLHLYRLFIRLDYNLAACDFWRVADFNLSLGP